MSFAALQRWINQNVSRALSFGRETLIFAPLLRLRGRFENEAATRCCNIGFWETTGYLPGFL
jgi:hypothetical protein